MSVTNLIGSAFEGLTANIVYDNEGTPINLTGLNAVLEITGDEFSQTYSSPSAEITIDSPNGIIDINLSPAQTSVIPCNSTYRLYLTDGVNEPDNLIRGFLTIA